MVIKTNQLMLYKAKVGVCSDIHTKHSTQSEHHVEFLNVNLLKPTGHVMNQQFNIQQLYVLPTPYLCVLYLSENKQRLVPLI